jgi:hypothetical protein
MKFLCLGYFDPEKMGALPRAGVDAVMAECEPHLRIFHDTGQVLLDAGLALESTRLRRMGGEVVSYASADPGRTPRVGGVQVIEAKDLEEAIRIAQLHPTTQVTSGEHLGWTLEIRPIASFHGTLAKE